MNHDFNSTDALLFFMIRYHAVTRR